LRVAYVLYTVEGCSYASISSQLQIPLQTVATKIHRARARLRQTLTAGRPGTSPVGKPVAGVRRRAVNPPSRRPAAARSART
jgi:hypothetical protein